MQLLVLLGIFVGYILLGIGVTVLLVKLAGRIGAQRTGKRVVTALGTLTFLLIPTWDFLPGWLHFKHLCETEAGSRIYKTVDRVEGFLLSRKHSQQGAQEYLNLGYQFIETTDYLGGKEFRLMRQSGGSTTRQDVGSFISHYALLDNHWQRLPWDVEKGEYAIIDLQTQERLAESKEFYYTGNWALRQIHQNFHMPCPGISKPHLYNDFLLKTLKPVAAAG
jgi:hypothetical protein